MVRARRAAWLLAGWLLGVTGAVPSEVSAEDLGLEFGLRAGFRQDDIEFSAPNRFGGSSSAKLGDTKVHHLEIFARADVAEGFYYRGSAAFGWVFEGNLQLSETGDDGPYDPTTELGALPYALVGSIDGDMNYDIDSGVGYQFSFFDDRLRIAPLGGYTYHKFNVRTDATTITLVDGRLPFAFETTGPAAVFDTEWRGPWVGADVSIEPISKLVLRGELQYSWLNFESEPTLVQPEISSVQRGEGDGFSWAVGVSYRFWKRFSGELRFHSLDWSAKTGRQMTVHWESWRAMAGAAIVF